MKCQTKTLPSGIVVENKPKGGHICFWCIKDTNMPHNEGELAIEYKDGDKFWYLNGRRHRLDGPAIEYKDGTKFYFIDNVGYDEKDYWELYRVKEYLYLKAHPELEGFV